MTSRLDASTVNHYLAHKQHLVYASQPSNVVQVGRDIVGLHATLSTSPYLSLWARMPDFRRGMLEEALYETRELAKLLCMRVTLHAVPSDEVPHFFQATLSLVRAAVQDGGLLVQAGLCEPERADALLAELQRRVLEVLSAKGPSTPDEISAEVPELKAKVRYAVGKSYEGSIGIGARLIPSMCAQGLLIRSKIRGTWRSNRYEYAPLANWLPGIALDSLTPQEAQAWLVRRYLAGFGPATPADIQWWTGLSKANTKKALGTLEPELVEVAVEGLDSHYLMLVDDARRLKEFAPPDVAYVSLLPGLDPYIMGYRDRRRFLAPEHLTKVFDRAGNAVDSVWAGGRVVGAWGQRKDGRVIYRLFERLGEKEEALLVDEARRLEVFLEGETLPSRFGTTFSRTLE
jgi:hypothetical protein